jgi:sec-independent protein translocase protein TatB
MEFLGVGPLELALVLIVTLLVVGPNRFPEVAREAARWVKLARRYAAEVTADVREAVKELEAEAGDLRETAAEFRGDFEQQGQELRAVREMTDEITSSVRQTETELRIVRSEAAQAARLSPLPPAGGMAAPREAEPAEAEPAAETAEPADTSARSSG